MTGDKSDIIKYRLDKAKDTYESCTSKRVDRFD